MKKAKLLILVGMMAWWVLSVPQAEAALQDGPLQKLGRGLVNLVTGSLELPAQVIATTDRSGSFAAATVGVGRGVVLAIGRTIVGAIELLTFPIPNPKSGYGPIIEPEFVRFRDADRWE